MEGFQATALIRTKNTITPITDHLNMPTRVLVPSYASNGAILLRITEVFSSTLCHVMVLGACHFMVLGTFPPISARS